VALEQWGSKYVETDLHDGNPKGLVIKNAPVPEVGIRGSSSALAAAKKAAERRRDQGNWPKYFWGSDGQGVLSKKTYLKDVKKGIVPTTFWAKDDYNEPIELGPVSWEYDESGHTNQGIKELAAVVGAEQRFETVKPLKLFQKIIQIWGHDNALILDPFAGAGTTGHATLELNRVSGTSRNFILIEQGRPDRKDSYARSLTSERVRRVLSGNWASGTRQAIEGGFTFFSLNNKVDAEAVLALERSQMADMIVASYFDSHAGSFNLESITDGAHRYLFAKNSANEGFFLIWEGADRQPIFTPDVYEAVVTEADVHCLEPTYHVYARFNLYQSDDVRFYQIPNQILIDFGLNETTDVFNNDSELVEATAT
jgi:adenine-specific DNA-methyltransferase